MRVALIFPETTIFEDPMVFPPLGLFYLRAVLEQAGHEVDYFDLSEYTVEADGTRTRLRTDPPSSGYDAYLVSGTSPQAREIRRIGKYLRDRGCATIVGGPHVTNYGGPATIAGEPPRETTIARDRDLLASYDVLVKREGEAAVLEALERRHEGQEHRERYGSGIVLEKPNLPDLGVLPIPNRDAAWKYRYSLEDEHGRRRPATTMFSSRGCPERCAFCDSPALWGRAVRYVPIPTLQRELEQIRDLGFEAVNFFDDILPLKRGRMVELADLLQRFGLVWRCFVRVDIMTHASYGKEFLRMLHARGLREVLVGVESGDQRILDGIHKGTRVEQNTIVREWCRELGIRFKASVILGLPGEDRASMEATLDWVLRARPDRVNICTYIPFPGTPIQKGAEPGREHEYGIDAVHDYDILVDIDTAAMDGEYFYSGSRDKLQVVASTSALTRAEIQEYWHYACKRVGEAGIPY